MAKKVKQVKDKAKKVKQKAKKVKQAEATQEVPQA